MEPGDLLKQTKLFAGLTDADIGVLSQSTRLETFRPGHVIVREGRVGAAFYVLISGKVEVIIGISTPNPLVVKTLSAGDFFGEIAVMKHMTRSASVRAAEETKCLVIRRLDLDSFIERYPEVATRVQSALSSRFGNSQPQ
jgi:CRP-like cAMP-binding protein